MAAMRSAVVVVTVSAVSTRGVPPAWNDPRRREPNDHNAPAGGRCAPGARRAQHTAEERRQGFA
jgi:hypothetical protein